MITEFRWLRHGSPVPRGWAVSASQSFKDYVHNFAVLIYRDEEQDLIKEGELHVNPLDGGAAG